MTAPLADLLATFREYLSLADHDSLALPPPAYLSPDLHALEIERIFRRSWLCVGREEQVAAPGDYYCFDLLDEPMVIVRGTDGVVRALNRVCRHRYMPVVAGSGNATRFICPYHSWVYETDGRLRAAMHMEGSTRFDRERCRLPAYRLENWKGFLFVNLDDGAAPLGDSLRTLDECLVNYRVEQQAQVWPYVAEWAGNWKLAAENSMEYYHHIGLHRTTVGGQMPAANTYLPPPPADLRFTHARCRRAADFSDGAAAVMNPAGDVSHFTEEERETGYMVYVFPAFTMAMRPHTNNWLSFLPDGPERTRVLGGYLVAAEHLEQMPELVAGRRGLIEKVNEEDSLATIELARVMRSTKAERGPLSPFEGTIAQFYRYLARTLCA